LLILSQGLPEPNIINKRTTLRFLFTTNRCLRVGIAKTYLRIMFTLKEQKALCRFCHNVWHSTLLTSFPAIKHKQFNIQWDMMNYCGTLIYVENTVFGNKERKEHLGADFLNLATTMQIQMRKICSLEISQEDETIYMKELKEQYADPEDLWLMANEGVKYALDFLMPNYEFGHEKGHMICNILDSARINGQRSKIASDLCKKLMLKDASWEFVL